VRRRSLPVVAALAAVTTLLLTAWGGRNESSQINHRSAGVNTGDAGSTASPTGGATDAAERPSITLSSDYQLIFAPEQTSGSKEDAALGGDAERLRSKNHSLRGSKISWQATPTSSSTSIYL
jgi:hypothetical protein